MRALGESGAELDALLAAPVRQASAAEFAAQFYAQHVVVHLPSHPPSSPAHDIAGAVRGTLGHVLMAQASADARAGRPCPFRPACTFDVAWRERRHDRGLAIPKPFVIGIDTQADGWDIVMTIFGMATQWTLPLADALLSALDRGVALPDGSALPAHGLCREIFEIEGLPDVSGRFMHLEFQTPLRWRAEGGRPFNLATFLSMLANRVRGIALWHRLDLQEDWHSLPDIARQVEVDAIGLHPYDGRRKSGRQGRVHGIEGYEGQVSLFGDLMFCSHLLSVGAHAHVGSGASLGFGRYRLLAAP